MTACQAFQGQCEVFVANTRLSGSPYELQDRPIMILGFDKAVEQHVSSSKFRLR
jgi:hypothetical protein